MLELDELKKLHDKAYSHGQVTREQASDDMVFYWVTQWDDQLLQGSNLAYRGEFNILRKAGRQVMADLRANPVQVNFDPKDPEREDAAEFLDGKYRADDRLNTSIEAYDYASQDAVVCGLGVWELYTEYETNRAGDSNQVIRRRWIPEGVNNAFCDPNSKRLDKSDARYWSVLEAFSEDGYADFVEDLTGDRPDDVSIQNFAFPERSYAFPWVTTDEKIYVVSFYFKEKVKDKVLTFADPFGQTMKMRESELTDYMDEMIDAGYEFTDEKVIERWQVTKYIASGKEIIKSSEIAGEYIPVIPVYGERSMVEGEEAYSGITRLAKDPQRLRNFQMCYLADIVSRSPRPKPIFNPEQIQGFEHMYEDNGADNNLPYLLQHRNTANGEPLPIGPVAVMPEQTVPQALMIGMDMSRQAVEDVANPGLPQNIADPDLSGKAVIALQNQINKQSYIYQHNLKFAKRYDGVVYASMSADILDTPRTVTVEGKDGRRTQVEVMQTVVDRQSGDMVVLNDLTNTEFEVFADIGPAYDTQRQETLEQLNTMLAGMAPNDPMTTPLRYKMIQLMDGVQFDDLRDYANKQLLLSGIKEPESEEEMMIVQQAQQAQQGQPNPAMMEGQARLMEGQAAMQNERNDANKIAVDQFNAETNRQKVQIQAAEAGVKIRNTMADTEGKMITNTGNQIDNISRLRGSVNGM